MGILTPDIEELFVTQNSEILVFRNLSYAGASKKTRVDYFKKARTSEPIESLGIKELQKRMSVRRRTTDLSLAKISEIRLFC
jgi:hypothetical protein